MADGTFFIIFTYAIPIYLASIIFVRFANIDIAILRYIPQTADMHSAIESGPGRTAKLFRLPRIQAEQLAEESRRTGWAEVRIVERALGQFLAMLPDERERFGAAAPEPEGEQ